LTFDCESSDNTGFRFIGDAPDLDIDAATRQRKKLADEIEMAKIEIPR
jgi:hypothetical protein